MGSTGVDTPFLDSCEDELGSNQEQSRASGSDDAEVPEGTDTGSGIDASEAARCEGEEVPAAQASPATPPVVEVVPSPATSELPTPAQKREYGINSSEQLEDTAALWKHAMLAASASLFGPVPTVTAAASYAPPGPKVRTNHEGQVAAGLKLDVLAAGVPENVIDSPKRLKCGSEVDAFKTALKNKRAAAPPQFICRICNNVSTMNSRYIGKFDHFDAMTSEEQKDFYLECQELAEKSPNGRLQWSAVKQLLMNHLVKSVSRKRSIRLTGEYLPLSVWEKRGFNPLTILEKGVYLPHPVLGDTYRVDLLSVDEEKVWAEMKDSVNSAMHRMRKRKSSEGAAGGTAAPADSAAPGGTPALADSAAAAGASADSDSQLVAMVDSSESEEEHPLRKVARRGARSRGSGSNAANANADAKALAQAAKQAEKDAKKALQEEIKTQKSEAKKLAKQSEKTTSLAQRTLAALAPLLDSAKKVLSAADLASTAPQFVDDLRVAESAASDLALAGKKWLTKAKKGPNADELGFDAAEAQKATKELKDSQFCLAYLRTLP